MKNHLGHKVASTKLVEPITRRFVAAIEQFVQDNAIPMVCFNKRQRKDEVAVRFRADFSKKEGVIFVGKVQEKCTVYRIRGPAGATPGLTYQLRGLRLHGIIERIPQSHCYRITDFGLRTALFFTRTYTRILRPGLAQALPEIPCVNSSLRSCFNKLQQEIRSCVNAAKLAA